MLHWLIVATIHHSCRSWSMHQKALLPSLSGFPHLWGCKRRIQNNLFSVVDECSKSVLKKYVKQPCTNYNRLTVTVLSWALTPFLYSVCLGGLLFDVHPHCCHYCCWVFPSSLFHWQQYLTNKHIIGDCLASFLTHLTHKQFTWNNSLVKDVLNSQKTCKLHMVICEWWSFGACSTSLCALALVQCFWYLYCTNRSI